MAEKKTIAIDFDGVIHSYTSGWQGAEVIPDDPVEGAFDAIRSLVKSGYEVAIYSTRATTQPGVTAMWAWLAQHDFNEGGKLKLPGDVRIVSEKPPALLYVDDRGLRFEGSWDWVPEIIRHPRSMTPWNKR